MMFKDTNIFDFPVLDYYRHG